MQAANWETYNKSGSTLLSIYSTWEGLIADLSFGIGEFHVQVETTSKAMPVTANGNWAEISGVASNDEFAIYLPTDFCKQLIEAGSPGLDTDALASPDATIILEHFLTPRLDQLENVFGKKISFTGIQKVTTPISNQLLGLKLHVNDDEYAGSLRVTGDMLDRLEAFADKNSSMDEKMLDPHMVVHLGPVVIPSSQAYLARSGASIDCGVMPSDTIKGVLVRKDRYYWPIHIEDEVIEIAGDLAGPIELTTAQTDHVFVTFGIGSMNLGAFERSSVQIGTRLPMDRYEGNRAYVYYQSMPYAQGHIALIGANLGVTVDTIGSF